jgi:hypothetical protein
VKRFGFLLVGLAFIAACSAGDAETDQSAAGTPTGPSGLESNVDGNVKITAVRVFIKDGRVQAFVQGELGDGCTSLQSIRQKRAGNRVDITVTSVRQGEVCTMILQFVNEWIPLDGPFAPGEYTVRANAATSQIRLVRTAGGALRVDPDPGPVPRPPYLPVSGPQGPTPPTRPPG